MRKTDDEIILQMLKKGESQKKIAEFFGVSPPYICKRVKKIVPLPESLEKLTEKEKKFVIEKSKGSTATEAVLKSFEVTTRESAKVIGSQLMAKPEIKMSITELIKSDMPNTFRIGRIKDHVSHPDPNISLKGLDMSFKLDGSYAPEKKMNINTNIEITPEIRERAREKLKRYGIKSFSDDREVGGNQENNEER